MRFDPEASWGANAGLEIPRKALENVKVMWFTASLSSCLLVPMYFLSKIAEKNN